MVPVAGRSGRSSCVPARSVPQTRGLSLQHSRILKSIFKGTATGVTQCNKDPICGRYLRLFDGGTKPTLAKLSLASGPDLTFPIARD